MEYSVVYRSDEMHKDDAPIVFHCEAESYTEAMNLCCEMLSVKPENIIWVKAGYIDDFSYYYNPINL